MDFKVIVAGGREFQDFKLLCSKLDQLLVSVKKRGDNIVIVSGKARGADSLGEKYARLNNYTIESHPANWNTYGKSAGYRRNAEMAKSASVIKDQGALVAFWDGRSRGTKSMIDLANKYKLHVRVIRY